MKIPKFITFSLWSVAFKAYKYIYTNDIYIFLVFFFCTFYFCLTLTLSATLFCLAAKFVSSSYINLCVIVFRLFGSNNSNNNNSYSCSYSCSHNKGSQKVSSFITCSNSSISLLTTRRHAKSEKRYAARPAIRLNHHQHQQQLPLPLCIPQSLSLCHRFIYPICCLKVIAI